MCQARARNANAPRHRLDALPCGAVWGSPTDRRRCTWRWGPHHHYAGSRSPAAGDCYGLATMCIGVVQSIAVVLHADPTHRFRLTTPPSITKANAMTTDQLLDRRNFYINGKWVSPSEPNDVSVIDPSTEQPCAVISFGAEADTNAAVAAAAAAFPAWSRTDPAVRIAAAREAPRHLPDAFGRNGRSDLDGDGRSDRPGADRTGRRGRNAHQGRDQNAEVVRVRPATRRPCTWRPHSPRTRRGVCAHHAVELADESGHAQGRAGTRRRVARWCSSRRRLRRCRRRCSPR